jgi:hypothetical protein
MTRTDKSRAVLNGVCPYFTMFPLSFPQTVLDNRAPTPQLVLDPFCGRGTTNFASRLANICSIGIDSNPVATAIAEAKLAATTPRRIMAAARRILEDIHSAREKPTGEFWEWAFHADVLDFLCRLREGLLKNCASPSRKALRAIVMGALHGPRPKTKASHFSNQCPRTYAPKPRYAVNFWKRHNLIPENMDVLRLLEERADRYYSHDLPNPWGRILLADSRAASTFGRYPALRERLADWVITSPPYYGLRTYVPDQWLRNWFIGGPSHVDYSAATQLQHTSPDLFASELQCVWTNVGTVCSPGAWLVIRFGSINDRQVDPLDILHQSLGNTGWQIIRTNPAGTASDGRRQAVHFFSESKESRPEFDVWARWEGS